MSGINRYDTPAQANFINTYVPIPFEKMIALDQMKQARVEENDKLTDETLAALNAIKVAPADEKEYLNRANALKTQILDIVNNTPPGSYEGKRKLMSLRNQLQVDPVLRSMTQNYTVYSDALTQLQEANKDPNITANTQPLNELIKNLSVGGKGTLGYMKETGGSGVYNRGTWDKYVDVRKAFEQYVNDVPESSIQQAGVVGKDGNKYILEQGTAGKTLNALGAPLGIKFTTNEKGEQIIDLKNSNIDVFLNTTEGKQIQNIARERVRNGQAKDYATEVQREYYTHALSAINERVSSKSTVNLAADPFDEARYKKELDDKVNPWSTPLSIATSGSKLSSFSAVTKANNTIDNSIQEAVGELNQFRTTYGITEKTVTGKDEKGQPYTTTVRIDKNGNDVSEAYALKEEKVKQLDEQKASLLAMVNRVKSEQGIPDTWTPNAQVKAGAEKARGKAEYETRNQLIKDRMYQAHEKTPAEIAEDDQAVRDAGDKAENDFIMKNDATWAKLNNALKTNAAKSSVIATATKFGSKALNQRAIDEFPLLVENEVQDVGTRRSYEVKEKEKLGLLSAKANVKAGESYQSNIVFGGVLFDPESQKEKFVYQVYDEKGKLSDPFMVDAPSGVVDDLIKSGATSKAKVIIHQQLTRLENNPDQTTPVTLGFNETKGEVRRTQPSGEHLKPKWLLTVNLKGEDGVVRPTEKTFEDRTALIDYYESYVRKSLDSK